MKKSKIASLVIAAMFAVTPAAFAGGLGDIYLPDSGFNAGGIQNNSPVSKHSGSVVNFYAPAEQFPRQQLVHRSVLVGLSIRSCRI
jgi:hypothetical protein